MLLDLKSIRSQYLHGIASEEIRGRSPLFIYWFKRRWLATLITGTLFGEEWFEEVLASERRPDYFQIDLRSENTYPRQSMRIIETGEMVLNLHQVAGFEERVNDIRTAGRDVETRIGELMGGRFFKQLGIMFVFRPPKGQKQEDYDIDYVRTDGKLGRCEVKSKLQETAFSVNTINNTFKQAKKQLPKNESGKILLRTPEDWVPFEDGVEKLQAIIDSVNRWFATEKTKRISSIVTFDSRTDVVDSIVYTNCYYREYKNPHCADSSGLPGYFLGDKGHAVQPCNWTSIPQLVEAWEPRR